METSGSALQLTSRWPDGSGSQVGLQKDPDKTAAQLFRRMSSAYEAFKDGTAGHLREVEGLVEALIGSFSAAELCGLLVFMDERCEAQHADMADRILQKLLVVSHKRTESLKPFTLESVMGAVIKLCKKMSMENLSMPFKEKSIHAVALWASEEMNGSASLDMATAYVNEAVRSPFFGLMKKQPTILVSAAKRICMELMSNQKEGQEKMCAPVCPTCPPALEKNLEGVGKFLQSMVNLYGYLRLHLAPDIRAHVANALHHLATCCEQFGLAIVSKHPASAWHRLVINLAKFTERESFEESETDVTSAAIAGLNSLAPVLCATLEKRKEKDTKETKETRGWDSSRLAAAAAAYQHIPSKDLFLRIAYEANKWRQKINTKNQQKYLESCHMLVLAFGSQGMLPKLEALLQTMWQSGMLKKQFEELKELNDHEEDFQDLLEKEHLHALAALCCSGNDECLLFATKFLYQHEMPLRKMVGIFENITPSHVKQLLLDKVLSTMCKGDLIVADLCKLFRGCEGDQNQNYLVQVQKTFNSKEMLDICAMDIDIPELAVKLEWLEVVSRYIRVPRLEAAFASSFMQRLAQQKPFKAQEEHVAFLQQVVQAAMRFSRGAFASMPAFVQTLATAVADDEFRLAKMAIAAVPCEAVEIADENLDLWTREVENLIFRDEKPKMDLARIERNVSSNRPDLRKEVQELGSNWLLIILARSKRVSWSGGEMVQAEPPDSSFGFAPVALSPSEVTPVKPVDFGVQKPMRSKKSKKSRTTPKTFTSTTSEPPPEPLEPPDQPDQPDPFEASPVVQSLRERSRSRSSRSCRGPSGASGPHGATSPVDVGFCDGPTEVGTCNKTTKTTSKTCDLQRWLREAAPTGALQEYEEILIKELDGDKMNLLEFVTSSSTSPVRRIDPLLWQMLECKKAGHKILLATAIIRLSELCA